MHTLTSQQARLALKSWQEGFDTFDIACFLQAPEEAVYNTLARIREQRRERAA